MDSIVSLEWLYQHLQDSSLVIIDSRFDLSDPSSGEKAYHTGHIPGAVYFDLERDLSSPVQEHGGRHPLPDLKQLAEKLGQAGIDQTTQVVVYDDQGGMFAPRLWWLLNYLGHDKVAVLDEGYSAWVEKGYPTTQDIPEPKANVFKVNIQEDWTRTVEEIKALDGEPLIDSRSPDRFRGENETMDPKAGHIPGASNLFWQDNLDGKKWLSPEQLKARFEALKAAESVTVYCGSGVTACANILAMKRAGLKNVKLYPGSWSDWVSYPDNPVETKVTP